MNIFKGKWLCDERFAHLTPIDVFHREHEIPRDSTKHPEELKNVHMLVRKRFELEKSGVYTLRITADDYYKLKINGRFVCQGPTPGYFTCYYWNQVDITNFLEDGENLLELEVYYQGLVNRVWNSGDLRMGFALDLYESSDGDDRLVLASDESFEYAISKAYQEAPTVGYLTQYMEYYDARYAALEAEDWKNCVVRDCDYSFAEEPSPLIEVSEVLPVTEQIIDGGKLYDFGREITASLNIRAKGPSGEKLRILCGEELDSTGNVRWEMRANCKYEEFFTLADGVSECRQYDYKGFRYVALMFAPTVSVESLTASERHYPFDEAACVLHSSDKILEGIFEICKNGVRCGSQEIYMDCPTREKGQYAGDMTVTSSSQVWLTGDISLLKKAIENQMQSSVVCPGLMAVTPGSFMQEIADYSLQFPILVRRYYEHTGDLEFTRQCLSSCKDLISYFRAYEREDGLLEHVSGKWNLVDWPENLRDSYDFPLTKPIGAGCHNVLNAFYVGCVKVYEELLDICGEKYEPRYRALADAFNAEFFDSSRGIYTDSAQTSHASLHSNIIVPYFGFNPDGSEKTICGLIMSKGLACGVYMSYFLLKGLCRMDCWDEAYSLIVNQSEHSWYNMLAEGATSCFEAWGKDQKWNTSLCHPWASAPIPVIIEDFLAVSPDGSVGESHIPKGISIDMLIPLTKGSKKSVRVKL